MKQYTIRHTVMISEVQKNTLNILKANGVNISQLFRLSAAKEIKKVWPTIREKEKRIKDAPDWLYDD